MAGGGALRLVLGDQLSRSLASLRDLDRAEDVVLLAEVWDEATYVPHHPKKIAFLFSAMRHFAAELAEDGVNVDYRRLDDDGNSGSLRGELARAVAQHRPARVVVTAPGEWRVLEDMRGWEKACGVPVEIREDDRFLCPRADFATWAEGRRQLRMEFFYRDMRRRTDLLMQPDGAPAGGQWNFDKENRKPLPAKLTPPALPGTTPDAVTREVLDLVAVRFADHFGDLEPFDFAVNARDAEAAFEAFVETRLPLFGDYQDAMRQDQPTLYHAVIGLYLNAGLLDPLACCRRAEQAWRDGAAPLNAVEGFIRQILGWREYVRGVYWLYMPEYADRNALAATRPLPDFYWTGDTPMNCLAQAIGQTRELAYAHHIQRLMVTGNFALLIGVLPAAICEWYLAVYADAYEWVELPNTLGMAMHADGGVLGSKPYAASGKYIDRMSDYCRHCRYDAKLTAGEDACPFNYLYWNFLIENADRLSGNPRMAMPYRTLARFSDRRRQEIAADSRRFLDALHASPTDTAAA